jgi:hypothetical protein
LTATEGLERLGRVMSSPRRGLALPLALFALVILSGLLLALLSMAGMEPEIAANQTDLSRARYLAEAGIEWALDRGIALGLLSGDLGEGVELTGPGGQPLPGLPPGSATFTVSLRNDHRPGDGQITGQAPDPGGPNQDTNGIVLLTATGAVRGAVSRIQVVLRGLEPGGGPLRITAWREER